MTFILSVIIQLKNSRMIAKDNRLSRARRVLIHQNCPYQHFGQLFAVCKKLGSANCSLIQDCKRKYQEGCIRHQQLPFLTQENLGFEDSVGFM